MTGRRMLMLTLALALVLAAGAAGMDLLPYGRELEKLALIRVLGADADGADFLVTAASGQQREQGGQVHSAAAGTVSGACLALQAKGSGYVFYGHAGQMLIGEEQARRDVSAPLDYVLRDVELRLSTDLYLVRGGTAKEVLTAEGDEDTVRRLETMAEDVELLADSMTRTVGETLESLERSGAAVVPAVERDEAGGIQAAGYGILKENALAGWLWGEAASGVNLAMSQVDADIVEVSWSGGSAALRVVGARTLARPVLEHGVLKGVRIVCRVEGNLAESSRETDLSDPALREELENLLAEVERRRLEAAVARSQALDADFLELGRLAALGDPLRSKAVAEQFSPAETPVEVQVTALLLRSYDTRR